MKLIVGLGNPGQEYINTRHNAGYRFIDTYAKENNLSIDKEKFKGKYTIFTKDNQKIILLKPEKYMNLSGEVIKDYVNYFKINIDDILIICDDMDLKPGTIKLKYKGSSGGHNGLKDIEKNLKTQSYKRLKIGIGKPTNNNIDYVIGKVSKEQLNQLNKPNKYATDIINDFIETKFDNVMNKYNTKEFNNELSK